MLSLSVFTHQMRRRRLREPIAGNENALHDRRRFEKPEKADLNRLGRRNIKSICKTQCPRRESLPQLLRRSPSKPIFGGGDDPRR